MIQITKSGLRFAGTAHDLDRLRAEFEREHCVVLKQFLEPEFFRMLQGRLEHAVFYERIVVSLDPPSADLCIEDDPIKPALLLLLNDPKLFKIVEHITGCAKIGCFNGGVYRMTSLYGHDTWHHDLGGNRLAALSINLSTEVYAGGVLQIRDVEKDLMVREVANTGFGDAVIFRIAPNLLHRVTQVEGIADKTAFAGKFKSEPDFQVVMRDNILRMRSGAAQRKEERA